MIRSNTVLWARPGLLALFLLPTLAYAGYSVADRWYQSFILTQEERALRLEISQLRRENLLLQADLQFTRSDQYVESVAREQLGLVRPGDRAFVLVGPAAAPTVEPTTRREAPAPPERSAWRRVLDALFGR